MSDIVWGPSIEVAGKRPDWLTDDMWDKVSSTLKHGNTRYPSSETMRNIDDWVWRELVSIRLPIDHFAYTAIGKGFTPWGGGTEAPKDWNGERILLRDGTTIFPYGGASPKYSVLWQHDNNRSDAVGYHPRPIAQTSPADTVTITKRTMKEWSADYAYKGLHDFLKDHGLVNYTKAENIAIKTGLSVKDVEAVLNAAGEGE